MQCHVSQQDKALSPVNSLAVSAAARPDDKTPSDGEVVPVERRLAAADERYQVCSRGG